MAQWVNWRASGLQVRIAVNLSARLLQDTDFVSVLRGLLEKHRVPGEALELEITESAMLYDSERALRVIRDIHSLGIALSIDDFGTGFSSLAYLRELPVHAVKLDKSFVTHLHERADDRSIVNGDRAHGARAGIEGRRGRRGIGMGRAVPERCGLRLRAGLPLQPCPARRRMSPLDRELQRGSDRGSASTQLAASG